MKKYAQNIGIFLIIIGTLILLSTRISHLSTYNSLLIAGLLCIVAGIFLHIRSIKQESRF